VASYNARFGREPTNTKDLHRKLSAADNLSEILAWREERTVTHNLTLHYDRTMLILEPTPRARSLARKKVEVVNYPDGRFAVQSDGVSLPFRTFDKVQTIQPGTIVDNKRLSAVLTMVQARQAAYAPNRQRGHVARQRPPNNLEAPGLPSKGRASRSAYPRGVRLCAEPGLAFRAAEVSRHRRCPRCWHSNRECDGSGGLRAGQQQLLDIHRLGDPCGQQRRDADDHVQLRLRAEQMTHARA
jgi:hypothetical protein